MKYKRVIIHWFSGTGNARALAGWIASEAEKAGAETALVPMTGTDRKYPQMTGPDTLLVFCYPTHGFNAPPAVLNFIARFPRGKGDTCFANTRAGVSFGPVYLPGLSGLAQHLPALMMKLKGYRIKGWRPIDLPSNWISVHPAFRGTPVRNMYTRCRKITAGFCAKLFDGKRVIRGLIDLPLDLALTPITVLYYVVGRFALSKTFIASHACTDCGACIKGCPVRALVRRNGRPYWTFWCESCMKCMNHCPTDAIQTPHGFIMAVWYACFSIIPALIATRLVPLVLPGNAVAARAGWWIGHTVVGLSCIWLAYRALQYLMRYKAFSWIVTKTSLTGFGFWGRYKPARDLAGIKGERI